MFLLFECISDFGLVFSEAITLLNKVVMICTKMSEVFYMFLFLSVLLLFAFLFHSDKIFYFFLLMFVMFTNSLLIMPFISNIDPGIYMYVCIY